MFLGTSAGKQLTMTSTGVPRLPKPGLLRPATTNVIHVRHKINAWYGERSRTDSLNRGRDLNIACSRRSGDDARCCWRATSPTKTRSTAASSVASTTPTRCARCSRCCGRRHRWWTTSTTSGGRTRSSRRHGRWASPTRPTSRRTSSTCWRGTTSRSTSSTSSATSSTISHGESCLLVRCLRGSKRRIVIWSAFGLV